MPAWDEIDLGWDELRVIPGSWRTVLSQWRGIYYIYDQAEGKGYVGPRTVAPMCWVAGSTMLHPGMAGTSFFESAIQRPFASQSCNVFRRIWMQTTSSGLKGTGKSDFTHARLSA